MSRDPEAFTRAVGEVAERDGRYKKEAYFFVYAALEYTIDNLERRGPVEARSHVTGEELLRGISEYGQDQYGPMTKAVFESWGVKATLDFGEIVFALVSAGMMGKTPQDSIEDFRDVYDFAEEFDLRKRRPNVNPDL